VLKRGGALPMVLKLAKSRPRERPFIPDFFAGRGTPKGPIRLAAVGFGWGQRACGGGRISFCTAYKEQRARWGGGGEGTKPDEVEVFRGIRGRQCAAVCGPQGLTRGARRAVAENGVD